jgi:hypothetical protein
MATFASTSSPALQTGTDAGFVKTFYPTFKRVENPHADRLVSLIRKSESTFDFDALNVFLRIGTFIGTDTPFRNVRAEQPDYGWATSIRPTELGRSAIIDAYLHLTAFEPFAKDAAWSFAEAVPILGTAVNVAATARDGLLTFQDYQDCMNGH